MISKIFDQNQYFRKFWPELIFSVKFDRNQYFKKFWRKSRFLENFDQKWRFSPKCWPKSRLPKSLTKVEMFKNFDQNWDNFPKCWQKSRFAEIEIFRKCWRQSIFSKTFVQYQGYQQFRLKSRLSNIWTKIEIFKTFDQNRDNCRKCWQKQDFEKPWPKSRFF